MSRFLKFLDTIAVSENTTESTFDPADLVKGKMTVYLVLPPQHVRAHQALLRMWIGTMLRAVVKGGLLEKKLVHFVLDEAATLGKMEVIDNAVGKYQGYGVRLQFLRRAAEAACDSQNADRSAHGEYPCLDGTSHFPAITCSTTFPRIGRCW